MGTPAYELLKSLCSQDMRGEVSTEVADFGIDDNRVEAVAVAKFKHR